MGNEINTENQRHAIRLAKILSKQPKHGSDYKTEDGKVVLKLGKKQYRFSSEIVSIMETQRQIKIDDDRIILTDIGLVHLKQTLNPDALLASAKNKTKSIDIVIYNQRQKVLQNINESPLLRLFTRKTKFGNTYISMEEFQAGEQLRRDFERGQLQPKISANLHGSVGSSGKSGFGDAGDITDFALDARKRVGKAIDQLGPELSGVTLDICCFLKGLEVVERDRQWPPRSAKLMLKTALALLARHYGISGCENHSSQKIHSWASSDYRPTISA